VKKKKEMPIKKMPLKEKDIEMAKKHGLMSYSKKKGKC